MIIVAKNIKFIYILERTAKIVIKNFFARQ